MTSVVSRKELPGLKDKYVYVQRDEVMYTKVGDEWARKLYFNTKEVGEILGVHMQIVYDLCSEMGIQAPAAKRRKLKITLQQLQIMADKTKNP